MKRSILRSLFLSLILTVSGTVILAQVPEGFNYMAIARDDEGNPVAKIEIGVRIAILDADMTTAWEEEHTVTTDGTGLFSLVIGDPLATQIGGYEVNFADIDWASGNFFVGTSISVETGKWIPMGTAQLFSVPYALVSKTTLGGAGNPFTMYGDTVLFMNPVHVKSSYDVTEEEALFAVKRKDGETMFAVYNQGVRISFPMDDLIKGAKGGFAIGGFSATKGINHDLFVLNKDSARIFFDQTPDLLPKGAKGGFAIGGFAYTDKADPIQNYLYVAPDSTRIYVKDAGKGAKGGFAIGGFGATKGEPATNFMDITPKNYFIGHEAGLKTGPTSVYNSVMGYQAAKNLTSGSYNTIFGYKADSSLTSGSNNIVIGASAGKKLTTGSHNTLIGYGAGLNHTNQVYNVMIGTTAGYNVTGSYNTFMGINAGYKIKSGTNNTFLGTNAGGMLEEGDGNTIIGIDAGRSGAWDPTTYHPGFVTSNNTIIGNRAGYNLNSGTGNVFIGYEAGFDETGNETTPTSNKFYLANTSDDPPLMYGDFSAKKLGINTKTIDRTFNVGGDAYVSGNLLAGSITAPLNGNVTGSLTGNVNGNVTGTLTGNVNGDVNGNLTGSVNGVETGKIYLKESQDVQYTARGAFRLFWDKGEGILTIYNDHETIPCLFWFRGVGTEPLVGADIADPKTAEFVTSGLKTEGAGVEVHFGHPDPEAGYCSVWVQFIDGTLLGHYIKY